MAAVSVVDVQVRGQGAVNELRNINNAARTAQSGINNLQGAVTKLAGAFSVIAAARFTFVKTAELEAQTRSLQVLTGSAEKATQIIQQLQQLGAVTPFTSTELIDAAKRLNAFGIEADRVVETTRRLADVSGATGAELQGLVTAYGQVQAKGRLQGEELLQFQERGIALQKELQAMYGMSGEEFRQALEKGRFSAQAVEVAIKRLTDAGGKYANGAIAQSDTLSGKFSTLQDSIEGVAKRLGTVLTPAMKGVLGLAINIANQINEVFDSILLQQQLGANLSPGMRNKLFAQAGTEAEQIARLRGGRGGKINSEQFVSLREQRFRDLMRQYGYDTGVLQRPKPTPVDMGTSGVLPALLGATGGGKKKGKTDAERAAEAAAKERQRVADVIRSRLAEGQILRLNSDLQDKISAAQAARDPMLVARLQGAQKELEIQYKYAQLLAEEKDLRAQQAIIFEGNTALIANQQETQRSLDELQRQADQDHMDAMKKHIEQQYQLNTAVQQQKALSEGIAGALGQGLTSTFELLIQGSQSWQQSLQQIASGVLVDIANQLLRIFVIEQAINSIRAFLTPFSPSTPIGAGAGRVGNYGTFGPNYGIRQRANGGSVMAGQGYLVGERGPELFMPGRSGGIAPTGSFGGAGNIVVNVDANGSNVQGDGAQANALGKAIGIAVQQELIKQKRPGGLLA